MQSPSLPRSDRASWLKGPQCCCSVAPGNIARAWRLVLLGAPGVGKGTQAELLQKELGACQLSTGDVFRTAKGLSEAERSPAMNEALGYMKRGELVPDATVLQMVRERRRCMVCHGGFLLDGFPRTVAQAEALEKMLADEEIPLDGVLSYDLPIEEIVSRLSGRRTCEKCKAVYHVTTRPSAREGLCDQCGGNLVQREDDRPESVRTRMAAYESATAPLADFYRQRKLLIPIQSTGSPDDILKRTMAALRMR